MKNFCFPYVFAIITLKDFGFLMFFDTLMIKTLVFLVFCYPYVKNFGFPYVFAPLMLKTLVFLLFLATLMLKMLVFLMFFGYPYGKNCGWRACLDTLSPEGGELV